MEHSDRKFSVASSLTKLISMVGLEFKIQDICNLLNSEISTEFRIKRIICGRIKSGSTIFTIEGDSKLLLKTGNTVEFDSSSIDWIMSQHSNDLYIIDESKKAPTSIVSILEADENESIAIFISKESNNLRHLVIFSPAHENISSVRDSEAELTELLRGVGVILEAMRRMGESLMIRVNIQSLFELAPVGIIICDSDGSVINANEQALLIMGCGLASSTLIGENLLSGEPFKNSGIEEVIKRTLAGEQVDVESLRFKCPSGKNVFLDARFRSTKSIDGKNNAIGIMADVTQRIRLQQQLERSYRTLTDAYQELQRVDKMKTRFIDTVSHELRTPLTVMRGYLELIQSEYSDKFDQKAMAKIKSIRANTERLYDLVESMLDVARIEQGAMEIVKQETSIKLLIEEVIASQQGLAHDKHQEITFVVQGEVGSVKIDHRKIRDAVKNILNNAIRYTPDGGKIQVGITDQGKMIHIWIKDNGIGIPTSDLEKIFDRFHIVVAKELSHQVDRMGLGLPLAKGVVESHKGKIWVESELGKGSIFHINLPKE